MRQRTIALVEEIEAKANDPNAFPVRTSPLCGSCQFQHVCPARRHLFEIRVKPECEPTLKDAAALVDRWVDVESERKAAAAALKAVEDRVAVIKDNLTLIAEQEGLTRFFGARGEVGVTVRNELIPPRKTHEPEKAAELEEVLRSSTWWPLVSALDRHALVRILNGDRAGDADLRAIITAASASRREIHLRLK